METNNGTPERTREEITAILAHAKLDEKDFLKTTQVLYIKNEDLVSDQYKLLELDPHLLDTLQNNRTLKFKGADNDNVVLCTDSRTYDVRECETSNSLCLVPNLELCNDLKLNDTGEIKKKFVRGINYKYLEVLPSKPHLDSILHMLEKTSYNGPENEFHFTDSKLYTFEELDDIAQSSTVELEQFLQKNDTIKIDNKIRMLDIDYHFRVLSFLLKSIDENSWQLDQIQKDVSINSWRELVPEEILNAIFDMYTVVSKIVDNDTFYKYKELKVCQFFARVLLQYAGKFNLDDFLQAWRDSVPDGMLVKEEMLGGIAIVDRSKKPSVIWALPENKLPNTIAERFQVLFDTKAKWLVDEITPYISSLTTDKMDANALLAKYARASHIDGVRYYSSKHDN